MPTPFLLFSDTLAFLVALGLGLAFIALLGMALIALWSVLATMDGGEVTAQAMGRPGPGVRWWRRTGRR